MGKAYGTNPIEFLTLPLGRFSLLLAIFQEGTAHEALEQEKERQRLEVEARRGAQ